MYFPFTLESWTSQNIPILLRYYYYYYFVPHQKKTAAMAANNVGVKSVPFSMFCYFFQICMTGNRWTLIKLNVNFYYAPSLLNVTPYRSYHSDLVLSCFTDCFKWFSNTESVNTARFLKYVWPFLNIMKEKVD